MARCTFGCRPEVRCERRLTEWPILYRLQLFVKVLVAALLREDSRLQLRDHFRLYF